MPQSHRSLWHKSRCSQGDANNFFKASSDSMRLSKDRLYIFRVNILREYKYSEDERRTVLTGEINTGFAVNYDRFHIDDIYIKANIKQKCNSSNLHSISDIKVFVSFYPFMSSRYQRYFSELYFTWMLFYYYN